MGTLRGIARVDGKVVCEGQMTFALGDPAGRRPEAGGRRLPRPRPLQVRRRSRARPSAGSQAGRVRVDGAPRAPIRPAGSTRAGDRVRVDGRRVGDETERVVLALHKPVGFITTRVATPAGGPTVYDARSADVARRWVFPVGRLDRDTSGLLVLTNDHRLGERLTDPEHHVPKTYHARVAGVPDAEALRALREGLPLDDGTLTRPAKVRVLGTARGARRASPRGPGSTWLEIVLTEGKNRQVRRMGAAVGHEVVELVRVRIGGLPRRALAPGSGASSGRRTSEASLAASARWLLRTSPFASGRGLRRARGAGLLVLVLELVELPVDARAARAAPGACRARGCGPCAAPGSRRRAGWSRAGGRSRSRCAPAAARAARPGSAARSRCPPRRWPRRGSGRAGRGRGRARRRGAASGRRRASRPAPCTSVS